MTRLCSSDGKTVLASTKTDEKGAFSLTKPVSGKLFYLRVSASGMDIYELRVRIDKHAADDLTIRLSVATWTSRARTTTMECSPSYDYTLRFVSHAYKITGKERDSESGLDNFGARYFTSSMGRFMSPDPLGGHLIPKR
jgi:RHS repeat-associated protein